MNDRRAMSEFRTRAAALREAAEDWRTDVGLVDLMVATAADMEAEAELYEAKRPPVRDLTRSRL
jgi:hypothetical protein